MAGRPLDVSGGFPSPDKDELLSPREWLLSLSRLTVVPSLAEDPRVVLDSEVPGPNLTLLALPLYRGPEPLGILAVWRHDRRQFTKDEIDLVHILADKSQMAIENAWLYSRTSEVLARQTEELSLLLDASREFASLYEQDEVLESLCRRLLDSVESTFCCVSIVENGGGYLRIGAAESRRNMRVPLPVGTVISLADLYWHRQVIEEGRPLILHREQILPSMGRQDRALIFPDATRSVLLMPLSLKGKQLGLAVLGEERSWSRTPFTPEKIELCRAMARQGALALENIRAFEVVSSQRARTQLIVDNVADGIVVTDLEGRILSFNPAAERISGYRADEVLGRRCHEVLRGLSPLGCAVCGTDQCPLYKLKDGVVEHSSIRRRDVISRRDGTQVVVSRTISPLLDRSGEGTMTGAVSVLRDVTREEELIRLKSEFISLVSHQLRTPLTSISGAAELLATTPLDEVARTEMLTTLHRQASRLSRLVNQVLQAGRLEQGQIRTAAEPLALPPLLRQTLNLYEKQYPDYRFKLLSLEPLPFVLGDQASVEVVLDNLIQNAINYSAPGSRIVVSLEERENTVVVAIRDEGIGIPEEQIPYLFRRFHRLPGETSHSTAGFGLGLYIVRTLIEAMGGTIWVESAPGRGTTFYFTLQQLEQSVADNPDC